jgi:hypothetical protein
MKKLVTILLLTLLIPATSFADSFKTGNDLLINCESELQVDTAHCLEYIKGIYDAHATFVAWGYMEPRFCVPKGVTVGQLRKIVVKYLNDNPQILHQSGSGRVSNSFFDAFPPSLKDDGTSYCPDKGES